MSFLSENDDPQKYKNDRESKVIRSGNRQSGIKPVVVFIRK
nr:MAG TPA: hypothetical protein [Bacteriophage sp.]